MTAGLVLAFLAGGLLGIAIRLAEVRYLRACLALANTRTAETYRKAAVLLARNNQLEVELAAVIVNPDLELAEEEEDEPDEKG